MNNPFLSFIRRFQKKQEPELLIKTTPKKIVFVDGDQYVRGVSTIYKRYLKSMRADLYFIKYNKASANPSAETMKIITNIGFIVISINGTSGKELVDKAIGIYIQKAILEGYNDITVVSDDYDFIDIFGLLIQANDYDNITYRLITPSPKGRLMATPDKINNIEIIKC